MLKKNLRAIFFISIFLLGIVSLLPQKTQALTANDYIIYPENARVSGYSIAEIKAPYVADGNKKTSNIGGTDMYYVTDGKTFAIYQRGNGGSNDPAQASLIGVITSDNKYRALNTPVSKTDGTAQSDAINSASKLANNDYDAYTSLTNSDNSLPAVLQKVDASRDTRLELEALQKQRQDLIDRDEPTNDVDEKIAATQKKLASQKTVASSAGQANQNAYVNDTAPAKIECIKTVSAAGVTVPYDIDAAGCAAKIGMVFLQASAWILWLAAKLFDISINYGLNFKYILDQSKLVDIGWQIFRDIANIMFIFVLLFIAINTIIGSNAFGAKSLLAKVIVTAILINFSLFFTKAIVDVSNVMALQFYGKIGRTSQSVGGAISSGQLDGIAAIFMQGLNLTSVYSSVSGGQSNISLNAPNMLIVGFGGSILILVTAFVFLAGAILFVIRTGVLIILMILSPLAFIASAIPNASGYASKWWSKLFSQALFAPIYMAIIYIVTAVISGTYGSTGFGAGANSTQSFAALFSGDGNSLALIFQFVLIMFFMGAALVVASQLGAHGGGLALSTGKDIRNWGLGKIKGGTIGVAGGAARGFIGGTASAIRENNTMRSVLSRVPGGGLLKGGLDKVAGAKFGTSKGFDQAVKDKEAQRKEMVDYAGGVNTFRRKGLLEGNKRYLSKLDEYNNDQKTASTDRKNAALGVKVNEEGKVVGVSGTFRQGAPGADARAFRAQRQKHIAELEKKGKEGVNKAKNANKYLEDVKSLVGDDANDFITGPGTGNAKIGKGQMGAFINFKQKATTYGFKPADTTSTLAKLHDELETFETDLETSPATTPLGTIETLKAKIADRRKKIDSAESKLQQRLDALETLHTPKEDGK